MASVSIRRGFEIVSTDEIKKKIKTQGKTFLRQNFTPQERTYCQDKPRAFEHWAARYAAKKAVVKALKKRARVGDLRLIHVRRLSSGKPYLQFNRNLRKRWKLSSGTQFLMSLAHEHECAVASVFVVTPS